MSNASSTVTYTSVYTDSEPWRYYEKESAETGSLRVIVYGYDGLPMQPVALPSPDYVPGPGHPPSPNYVPGPKHLPSLVEVPYVPEPEYPDYVADFDPNEDSKEDPKDDHADYPADEGDGDDEPSDDDDDDDDTDSDPDEDPEEEPFEDEEDDEEEKEHLAPANSFAVLIVDPVLPAGDTEALEADVPTPTSGSPHIIIPLFQTRLPPTTLERVDQRVTELDTTIRQRTNEFEIRFEEAQDDRAFLRARVNTLFRDMPDHRRTALLLDREAMYAREAWSGSEDRSS
nr:hypothetical protein [Tanacetum cinerariifolium]